MMRNTLSSTAAINQLVVCDPLDGGILSTPDDLQIDTKYYFVKKKKSTSVNQTFYYRNLIHSYEYRHEGGTPRPFEKAGADQDFAGAGAGAGGGG